MPVMADDAEVWSQSISAFAERPSLDGTYSRPCRTATRIASLPTAPVEKSRLPTWSAHGDLLLFYFASGTLRPAVRLTAELQVGAYAIGVDGVASSSLSASSSKSRIVSSTTFASVF